MITDEQIELLTAAVDGELCRAQAEKLRALLASSSELRSLFRKFKADSKRLGELPLSKPIVDVQKGVMAKIREQTPRPRRYEAPAAQPAAGPKSFQSPSSIRAWIPIALAASVLLMLTAASFSYFTRDGKNAIRETAINTPVTGSRASDSLRNLDLPREGTRPTAPMPAVKGTGIVTNHEIVGPSISNNNRTVAIAPMPQERSDPLFAPLFTPTHLDLVQIRVPFLKPLSDFDREDVRQLLKDELGREPAFRIDLFTRDTVRAVHCFQHAAKSAGISIHADATTMTLLNKRQLTSPVFAYMEALTPRELVELFAKLNAEDAKISPRVFDVLHASHVTKADETELRNALGVDAGLSKRPAAGPDRKEIAPENGKPISSDTADQIVKSIATGQGKPSEKGGLLMAWGSNNARPASSAELKTFLSKRGERKPNAVPVIIVFRHGS